MPFLHFNITRFLFLIVCVLSFNGKVKCLLYVQAIRNVNTHKTLEALALNVKAANASPYI